MKLHAADFATLTTFVTLTGCSTSPSKSTASTPVSDAAVSDAAVNAFCPSGISDLDYNGVTDAGAACTYTTNIGSLIPAYGNSSALPTGKGGTVVPGTYVFVNVGAYSVPPADNGAYLFTQAAGTLIIGQPTSANTYPVSYNELLVSGCVATTPSVVNGTYTIDSENTFTTVQNCPADPTGVFTEKGTFTSATNDAGITTYTSYIATLGGTPLSQVVEMQWVHP